MKSTTSPPIKGRCFFYEICEPLSMFNYRGSLHIWLHIFVGKEFTASFPFLIESISSSLSSVLFCMISKDNPSSSILRHVCSAFVSVLFLFQFQCHHLWIFSPTSSDQILFQACQSLPSFCIHGNSFSVWFFFQSVIKHNTVHFRKFYCFSYAHIQMMCFYILEPYSRHLYGRLKLKAYWCSSTNMEPSSYWCTVLLPV